MCKPLARVEVFKGKGGRSTYIMVGDDGRRISPRSSKYTGAGTRVVDVWPLDLDDCVEIRDLMAEAVKKMGGSPMTFREMEDEIRAHEADHEIKSENLKLLRQEVPA